MCERSSSNSTLVIRRSASTESKREVQAGSNKKKRNTIVQLEQEKNRAEQELALSRERERLEKERREATAQVAKNALRDKEEAQRELKVLREKLEKQSSRNTSAEFLHDGTSKHFHVKSRDTIGLNAVVKGWLDMFESYDKDSSKNLDLEEARYLFNDFVDGIGFYWTTFLPPLIRNKVLQEVH